MKKPMPDKIDLTEEDAHQLIERISASNLSCDDIKIIVGVVHFCLWLQTAYSSELDRPIHFGWIAKSMPLDHCITSLQYSLPAR